MTKRLIVVRHGKSDQTQYGLSDFERVLNDQGNKNAEEMAKKMQAKDILPDLMVSSPAKRALSTAKHFARVYEVPTDQIQLEPSIYEANTMALLKVVNNLNNAFDTIALFGHNPGLTELVNYLADANIYDLPTASISVIDFPFDDWSTVSQHTGNLSLFDYPNDHDNR